MTPDEADSASENAEVQRLADINDICDAFEDAWLANGDPPNLRAYLPEDQGLDQAELFHHLLELDLDYRRRRQLDFSPEQYRRDFPEFPAQVEAIVGSFERESEQIGATQQGLAIKPPTGLGGGSGTNPSPGRDDLLDRKTLGEHVLLDRIGKGGMGVVYKGHHRKLQRTVALKVIRSGEFATKEERRRFQTEAQTAAKLHHPNIVSVFDVGEDDGHHYFSMEFVKGTNLSEALIRGPINADQSTRIAIQICDAVTFAHEHDVIHRDLKPANVLLTDKGEAKVTDFGLAKRMEVESSLTKEGQIIGTPSYMPPEQAMGGSKQITPKSDLYSIGAILYAMLTGVPPFRSENVYDTVQKVLESPPVPPRLLNPEIPTDLETICLKCLQKTPNERYASVQTVGDELRRFRDGRPIQARSLGLVARTRLACRRNPVVAGLIAITLLCLLTGVVASTYFAVLANQRANRLEEAVTKANRATTAAQRHGRIATDTLEMVISNVDQELQRLPGGQRPRRNVLAFVQLQLEEVLAENRDQADLATAKLLIQLGTIVDEIENAPQLDPPITLTRSAQDHWQMAIEILSDLTDQDNDDTENLRLLGQATRRLGRSLLEQGQVQDSANLLDRQIKVCQRLLELAPNSVFDRDRLAVALLDRAHCHLVSKNREQALAGYVRSQALSESTLSSYGFNAQVHSSLLAAVRAMGDLELEAKNIDVAVKHFREAVELGKTLVARHPSVDFALDLAHNFDRLGQTEFARNEIDQAAEAYEASLTAIEKALTLDANDPRVSKALVKQHVDQTEQFFLPTENVEQGLVSLSIAIHLLEERLEQAPQDVESREQLRKCQQLEARIRELADAPSQEC